jgi:hypothetical protein
VVAPAPRPRWAIRSARCGPDRRPANHVERRHGVGRLPAGYRVGGEVAALLLRRRPAPNPSTRLRPPHKPADGFPLGAALLGTGCPSPPAVAANDCRLPSDATVFLRIPVSSISTTRSLNRSRPHAPHRGDRAGRLTARWCTPRRAPRDQLSRRSRAAWHQTLTGVSSAPRRYGLRPTPQNESTSAGRPEGLGSGCQRGGETTPGSTSSRPSKKRAIRSGLRRW